MELGDLTLEVRDKNLKRVGVILPDEATFTLRDEFNNVGAWEIDLPLEHPLTNALRTPGAGIRVTGPAGVLLTGPMTEANSKGSRDDPEGMVNFKGVTDDILLNDYLAYPVPENPTMAGQKARANDIRTGKAETVMHQYVSANLGPSAPAARRCALLRLGANAGRGPDVHKSARFPMMGTLLTEIAVLGNLGYRVIQRGGNLVFETYAQQDKRKRIRMDLWNNTLASYELTVAGAAVTHVIVAGQEEGVDRQLVERTTAASLAQMALWGRRKEKFLDRRSTDEIAELEQAGDEVLEQQGIDQSIVKFVPMDETTMRYQVDWNIGDIVTAVIEGREIPAVVTAAIIKVDTNGVRVACALGDISATDERAEIRSFMAGTETRLSILERSAGESGSRPSGEISMFAGGYAPTGWLLCNGDAVSRSVYADLFAVIGTTYGAGNGSTTFNIPDLRARSAMGADARDADFFRGIAGGSKTHSHGLSALGYAMFSLTATTIPFITRRIATAAWSATHQWSNPTGAAGAGGSTQATGAELGGSTNAASSLSPYLAVNYIIKT